MSIPEDTIRVATWNLDHAYNSSRPVHLQIETILKIDPDILILTETCATVDLTPYGFVPPIYTTPHTDQKYYSAIWSKFPVIRTFPTFDGELAVCAKIITPLGAMLVYATIVTYHADRGPTGNSPTWFEHHKSIDLHGEDWLMLAGEAAGLPLIVGGDFNQTRDGSKAYCSKGGESIDRLTKELLRNNLVCLTE